jgi:transposase
MAPGNRKTPTRAKSSESTYSLMEFIATYPDDESCLTFLWNARYNLGDDQAHCARCEEIRPFKRYTAKQQRQDWTCTACGLHVHPTAGTIFHKSSTSLHLWFYAMYIMASTRCGISAKQLERELGVTYKTAWRMFTKIRNQLMTPDETKLAGPVEADEMYVGGRPRLADQRTPEARVRHRNSKTMVFGAVERGGRVQARVIQSNYGPTLQGEIARTVVTGSTVYTDQAKQYHALASQGYEHHSIDHGARVYVAGDVHVTCPR